jgi:hypothetical protein
MRVNTKVLAFGLITAGATVLAACSSDEGSSWTPGGAQGDVCEAGWVWEKKCTGATDEATYKADCKSLTTCQRGFMAMSDFNTVWQCVNTRDCSASEDSCYTALFQTKESDPAIHAALDVCDAKTSECSQAGQPLPTDFCTVVAGGSAATRSTVDGCLKKACAEARACLDQMLASAGCSW